MKGSEAYRKFLDQQKSISAMIIYSVYAFRADFINQCLAKYKFDINRIITRDGCSLLGLAAILGRLDIVEILLRRGALTNKFDKNGSTALHYASMAKNRSIMDRLVESGADETVLDNMG